jgi:non-lysosomal glucosylceramidase
MRPLAIWAMQWALTRPNIFKPKIKSEVKEECLFRQHSGFSTVSCLLKLPEEGTSKSLLQVAYDYTKKKIGM